jgi:phosphohistidine phosphatase
VVYQDTLYHAAPETMLELLQATPAGVNRVMLVGHNPEIQAFGLDLVGSGPKPFREGLMRKYPTAGLAVINFEAGLWKNVPVNSGKLNLFLSPRDLKA